MKKNLMSVLILALVLVNLILTGILTITILPQTKKSNELVNKVCSAIDLELESGDGTESASIPMDQVETYKIEDAMTINLKTGADGETHYVKLTASISMDSKNDGYKTYGEDMAERPANNCACCSPTLLFTNFSASLFCVSLLMYILSLSVVLVIAV